MSRTTEVPRTSTWLVVDVMNVVGSRPDGWWHDRDGAVRRLLDRLRTHAASHDGPVTAVVDLGEDDGVGAADVDGVEVVLAGTARDAADDAIVALLAARGDLAARAVVVTADRALRERVRTLDAGVVGPRWLLEELERSAPSA